MDALSGKTVRMLSVIMDYRLERHKVIASNIANIDTPGYRSKDLVFGKELKTVMENEKGVAMVKTSGKHLSEQSIHGDNADFEVVDSGKRVNLESEMAKLAENNLMYNLAIELMARKFRSLKTVLTEAR